MDLDDAKLIVAYIEASYTSMETDPPRKDDGKVDVIRARGVILNWEHQGHILGFDEWWARLTGESNPNAPEWPEHMEWPPFKAMREGRMEQYS